MRSAARRSPRRRRLIVAGCAALLAVPITAAAWIGVQGAAAARELTAAVPLATTLVDAVQARDVSAASVALGDLREHLDAARDASDSALWRLAEVVPGVGDDLAAVRTLSASLSHLAGAGMDPLLQSGVDGTLDLAALAEARPALIEAAAVFADAREAVARIDASTLLPPVAAGTQRLQSMLDVAAPAVDTLAQSSAVVPGLLGADGPRSILVMLQNNAEPRTGGGITGAFVEMRAENGALHLVRQADSSQFAPRDEAIAPVSPATVALYGDAAGGYVQNATMPADFATSAALATAWWSSAFGETPDVVVAIDPLVLRALLSTTGPVSLPDGSTISADDVVDRLMIDPYRTLDPQAQTTYLQDAAGAVFTRVSADIDPVAWATALAPVVAEGRVSVWSSRPAEQQMLASSAVGGPRARQDAAGADAYAVYLNDATGGKMGPYLDVAVAAGSCDGADVVRVTLTNTLPASERETLPASVTGGGLFGTAVGDIGTNVTVSAPADAGFGGVAGAEGPELSADAMDDGHPSSAVRVNVSPGESETVAFTFVRAGQRGAPRILSTPLIDPIEVSVSSAACAG